MKKFSIEIKWAIIFAVASLLWMVMEKSVGWHDRYISRQMLYTNLFVVISIGIYILALRDKKRNYYQGEMNWTQGFLSGVILSVIIAIFSPAIQTITFKYITPDYFENMMDFYVSNNVQTRENAAALLNIKSYILQGLLGGLSMGIVIASVIALFLREKKTAEK